MNASSEGIRQFGAISLLEWKVDTNTEKLGPIMLRMERTNCSSFFSILHCLHCMTKGLNLEKNYWMFWNWWVEEKSIHSPKCGLLAHPDFQTMNQASSILPSGFLIHQGGRVTPWRYEFTRNQRLHPIPSHTSISLNYIRDRPLFPLWPYIDVCCTTQDTYLPSNPNNWRVWRSSVLRLLDFPFCSFRSSTNPLNSSIYLHMTFNLKENQFNHTLLCAHYQGASHLDKIVWKNP